MSKPSISARQVSTGIHVLVWATLLALPWFLRSPAEPHDLIGPLPAGFFLLSAFLHMGLFYGNAFYLYPRLCRRRRWPWYLLAFLAAVLAVNALKVLILQRWYPEIGDYTAHARFIFGPSFFAMVAGTIYRYAADRILAERRLREREAEQLAMELKFLRSQISPHFLFNVLTNLVSLARKKSELLEPSLLMLADLMRYMLYDSDEKKVPLTKEAEYLQSYIALQRLRFGDSVDISAAMTLSPGGGERRIEPMLLIPFVENAFKHGVGWIQDPRIAIRLEEAQGVLRFSVENAYDPGGRGPQDGRPGIGLPNVRARLQLLYPGRHTLQVSGEKGTFHVHLTIHLS